MKNILLSLIFLFSTQLFAQKGVKEMFDDFNYEGNQDPKLLDFGWTVRKGNGGPGAPGCSWSEEYVSFAKEPDGNGFMILKASTKGAGNSSIQSEIHHKREYLEGTYAARIFFNDAPLEGDSLDGDQVNQTFFAISPLAYPLDTNYSELDFVEYLPNGGWGTAGNTLWMTSWETYQPQPWVQVSKSDKVQKSHQYWHTIACVAANNTLKYYVDGELMATHTGKYYPEQKMSINFNQWFIAEGFIPSDKERTYIQLVDWVYFSEKSDLAAKDIPNKIEKLRASKIERKYDN